MMRIPMMLKLKFSGAAVLTIGLFFLKFSFWVLFTSRRAQNSTRDQRLLKANQQISSAKSLLENIVDVIDGFAIGF